MILRQLKKVFTLVLLGSALALTSNQNTAVASTIQTIPLLTIHCSCSSIADMKSTALMYYTGNFGKTPTNFVAPAGSGTWQVILPLQGSTDPATKLMVVSDLYPVTGLFKGYYVAPDVVGHSSNKYVVQAITADNAATIALDGRIMARALEVKPINVPKADDDADVNIILRQTLIANGQSGYSVWHAIFNFPQILFLNFTDLRTGKTVTIFVGDTVTVIDANGNSAKFKLADADGTMEWQYVDGSLKDKNGNPIQSTSTPPANTQSQTVVPNAASENWVVNTPTGLSNWLINLSVALGGSQGEVIIEEIPQGGQPGSGSIKVVVSEEGF